jgi:protein O-mannosyl-transferase
MNRASSPAIAADSTGATDGWRVLAVAAVLILAALGAYWNSFNVPFLLDDALAIGDNPSLRHLGRIVEVLSPPPTGTTAARPLVNLSFALNYAGGGTSVPGYHVVNLLIHICSGLALLGIVRRTLLSPGLRHRYGEAALPLAAFAALLWTLHPLQTESVTYISQRAESLMGLFYLLTLYCFIRAVPSIAASDLTKGNEGNEAPGSVLGSLFSSLPSVRTSGLEIVTPCVAGTGWLGLSLVACFCGMATKQVMVTAPVLVLLYDRAFVSRSFRSALAGRRWYYAGLAASWLWLGFLMHRSALATIGVGFNAKVRWPTYALTEVRVIADYLKLAVWPHPLVFDYGPEILATHPLMIVPYAVIVATVLIAGVIAWRRRPMAGFLGAWFFLILAPTSTVVPIAEQPMAESRMYLSLAAVIVLVTLLSYALSRRWALVALGLVAAGFGALTIQRNHDYRSELSIWEDTAARQPQSSRAQCNFGVALAGLPSRAPDAIAHFAEALRLKPDNVEAHNGLATVLAKIPGRLPDAIAHCEEALRLKPNYAEAHNSLGSALAEIPGHLPDAIAHFEKAVRLKPDLAEAYNNLGLALAKVPGRAQEAVACYEKALHLNPALAEAHNNVAIALAKMPGRLSDVVAHYDEALRLKPTSAEVHYDVANALTKIPGRLADAIGHYETALRLKPDFVEAHNNLAIELAKMPGRLPDAVAHYEAVLRLKPAYAEAHNNLAIALAQIPGRLPDAIAHYEEAVRLKPAYAEAHNNLAVAYAATGQLEAAIGQLEIATRLDPASTGYRDYLEKLKARRRQ